MDPFETKQSEIYQPPPVQDEFPDFNVQKLLPQLEDEVKTITGRNLEKGSDILKKSMSLYWVALGLTALLIILPALLRLLFEFSSWAYEWAGKIFP